MRRVRRLVSAVGISALLLGVFIVDATPAHASCTGSAIDVAGDQLIFHGSNIQENAGSGTGDHNGQLTAGAGYTSLLNYCSVEVGFDLFFCFVNQCGTTPTYLTTWCCYNLYAADNATNPLLGRQFTHTFTGLNPGATYCYFVDIWSFEVTNSKNSFDAHRVDEDGAQSNIVCGP